MKNSDIPRNVIATVGDVLGNHYYSHSKLNTLFWESGAHGDPPSGNCVAKCQSWLLRCNQETDTDAFQVLGSLLAHFMELEWGEFLGGNIEAGQERIRKVLERNSLEYSNGAIVCASQSATIPQRDVRAMEISFVEGTEESVVDNKKVFVVHGRNEKARRALIEFLRSIGLQPIEWAEALKLSGQPSPYVGEVLEAALQEAAAVVVLFTGDDEARLQKVFWTESDGSSERNLTPQARPNVLFEAGLAFGTHPKQTVLVQLGTVRPFSDIAGRHVCHLTDRPEKRLELARKLISAGCDVSLDGSDLYSAGNFGAAVEPTDSEGLEAVERGYSAAISKKAEHQVANIDLQLMEKRLRVINAIRRFLQSLIVKGGLDEEERRGFLDETQNSQLLFDVETKCYVREIDSDALTLEEISFERRDFGTSHRCEEARQIKQRVIAKLNSLENDFLRFFPSSL